MSQVVVDGLMTDYQSVGKGKVVLLLHGWGDTKETFNSQAKALSTKFQVVTLDLPGFGKTQAPDGVWGLDDYAKFVATFLSKLSHKVYAVVGHSNGGAVLIRGLANNEISSEKLVLIASAGIRGEYKGRNMALRLITKLGKLITTPFPETIKSKLKARLYKTVGSDMMVAEHLQETFKNVVTDDVREDASKVVADTLLIYGAEDKATPVRYAEIFSSKLPKSTVKVIDGHEHFVHQEDAETVNKLLMEFLT